ncbi:MAG: helix-turn-helix transcriptional regulator [Oligoflexia bacterium]|nr:helix-turn-helix transcriptional regulator [Oligoflexia bacterium]MBF0367466.1 helix-turn-helix transcriptional regulator [Oligoflexia bacterium]
MKNFKDVLNKLVPARLTSGGAIRALRKSINFTLKDVEKLCGIKETHLSSIENGKIELSLGHARKIAAALGVHPSVLLFPNGEDMEFEEIASIDKKRDRLIAEKKRNHKDLSQSRKIANKK